MKPSTSLTPKHHVRHDRLHLTVDDTSLDLAIVHRAGDETPILFLHGWGSSKEDYLDIQFQLDFAGVPFLAYDAPGCGDTRCDDLSNVNIGFLTKTAEAVLHHFNVGKYHLLGHSMGGITALELAHRNPDAVCSFINIKGNLASEDCFITRQILEHPNDDMEEFLQKFITRTRKSPFFSSGLYAAGIRQRVQAGAIRRIFESMVDLSDNGDLLRRFLQLPFPKMFMFGEQHASLSYLPELADGGVQLAEIPAAGHFPMYSNPVAMWEKIRVFVREQSL